MFDTVLIANRGEIAVRIARTLHDLGIRSVAVYSDADTGARHTQVADIAVHIGGSAAAESYLNIDAILDAAGRSGAQAIHPGYGFLAENPAFARACEAVGIVFIGPPVAAIEAMGDKIRAKQTVQAAGVPVVPGRHDLGMDDEALVAASHEIGLPVLLKPSAGGGGKGMRLVTDPADLADEIAGARREARSSFGDDALLVERYVDRPRHIEIQVLADNHGTVLHLGERECSLQRRHQKIIEEAPSPLLDADLRESMGQAAVDAARTVGYVGAGTVEFIISADRPAEFFFLEMNTRLQVEHPVTELVSGIDLVEAQVRIAAGQALGLKQSDITMTGHAIEARVYAEDPARGFLPSAGRVLDLHEPSGSHVRVDSSLSIGTVIGTDYDPMLSKVIAWGHDREAARRRLLGALADTVILGLRTNVGYLRALLADPAVVAGDLDTGLVERRGADLLAPFDDEVLAAAALLRLLELEPISEVVDPFDIPGGWRMGQPAWASWRMQIAGEAPVTVRVRGRATAAEIAIGDGEAVPASARWDDPYLHVTVAGRRSRYAYAQDGEVAWFGRDGDAVSIRETDALAAARHSDDTSATTGAVLAPMPGTVTLVRAAQGDTVVKGQPLVVVEAMKMEHVLTAPMAGVMSELLVVAGQQVAMDERLAVVVAEPVIAPTAEPKEG
ncbi:MAG: acetyl/propionyl/methylcrotonyl-CoA carboxylase subunit alpha [Actinomycetota bacterium]|nr:acetyl/propionyl/methylcrotonyl-CoA carboxylase subunit alpha [Actinomycetota bacterium]MDQ3734108.1 acetyl/propionyl/methylcrotonyl-CoA carboxylase subunit alpha [Actinomycetota bacterium]